MLNIKVLFIPDIEKLIQLIAKSKGKILLLRQNRTLYDLTDKNANMDFLKEEVQKGKGIDVYLSDKDDYFCFINYMVYAGYD